MKILFATMPFDGHFNPLTGIAVHLKESGHDVRWYAGPSYAKKLERMGIPYFPFKCATEVNGDNIGELFPERAKLKGMALIRFEGKHIFVSNGFQRNFGPYSRRITNRNSNAGLSPGCRARTNGNGQFSHNEPIKEAQGHESKRLFVIRLIIIVIVVMMIYFGLTPWPL